MDKPRIIRQMLLFFGLPVILLVGFSVWYYNGNVTLDPAELAKVSSFVYPESKPVTTGGMTTLQGAPLQLPDYQGSWLIVNFGYLSCPDICPVNLAAIKQTMARFKKEYPLYELRTLHVTIDPDRDTRDRMEAYLEHFGEGFIGVSGDVEATRQFANQMGTVFYKDEPNEHGDYLVGHSDNIALINPAGELTGFIKGPHTTENLFAALEMIIPARTTLYDLTATMMPCH